MNDPAVLNLALPVYCHARTTPTNIAIVVDGREHTYSQLRESCGRVAAWLARAKRTDGQPTRVGVLAARSFEMYSAVLGIAWARATYIPLNPKQPATRLLSIIQQTEMDALIVDQRGAARLAELAAESGTKLPPHVLAFEPVPAGASTWDSIASLREPLTPGPVASDVPAYIIFTSGTTGTPKGVMVSAANLTHYLAVIRALYHFSPADRVAQFFENSFDVSVHEMFSCWDGGAALHVVPENKQMAPGGFIREQQITVWQSVPSVMIMMTKLKQLAPGAMPSLRVTNFGGEGVPIASLKTWQAAAPNSVVDNKYGPTEATIACLFHRLTDPPDETPDRGTLAIGKPFVGMDAAIVGPDLRFLPAGETGELAVSGPQVALGYFNDDTKTERQFPTLDHPHLGVSRWYLTGDLAYEDEAGLFHCLGRIDHQVKVNGFRVELEEIEAHLRAACGTDDVAAIAWPAVNGNATGVVAFVSGARITPSEVREELRNRVPHYMIPNRVLEIESMPLSINGKIDRKALAAILDQVKAEPASPVPPQPQSNPKGVNA